MSERVPSVVAAGISLIIIAYACATAPSNQSPTASPQANPSVTAQAPGMSGPPGQRPPLTDSARRVRDSVNSLRRDSAAAMVMRSIAGHENEPAEQVFKNIKIFKGVPAGRLVSTMNMGFGRSLGVSCGFCHVPGKWDLDDKQEKETARLMFAMVQTINRDYMSKVPNDRGGPPMVGCFTCHRGNAQPMGGPPPGGPPPGSRPNGE